MSSNKGSINQVLAGGWNPYYGTPAFPVATGGYVKYYPHAMRFDPRHEYKFAAKFENAEAIEDVFIVSSCLSPASTTRKPPISAENKKCGYRILLYPHFLLSDHGCIRFGQLNDSMVHA